MNRTIINNLLNAESSGYDVLIKGWIRTKRESKGFCFIEVNDGSTIRNMQVIADETLLKYDEIKALSVGCSVSISGELVDSPGKGQRYEIRAKEIIAYGIADPEAYPLQKKRHSFEFLREIAHLRPRTNTFGAVLRVRNALTFAIHKFFQERGFIYVHTPIITASDCEGAGEIFKVTTLDLMSLAKGNEDLDYTKDFFGKKVGLTVSGQLEGEALASALGNIYTFGPTFRAENSNTARHLSEFWMVEPEMAFAELEDNVRLAEDFLRYILKYCLDNCQDDMEFFNIRIKKGIIDTIEKIINSKFEVITYTEAIDILAGSGMNFEFPVKWGLDLQSEHERFITENKFKKPIVIINYPQEIKAFYMKLNQDEKTVRAMDVLVPGIGEIIGGSEREDRYDVLLNRMKSSGIDPEDYWWYLDIRRFGTIPHSGFGLGLERTIQLITGMQNIRDVIPFPRSPKSADF
ncbi:MAG: asparagine--tRNA ligase [Spirochaetota bacterium]|nr:asparagine--tRNA ligase [Spirochaetota bacterium]